MAVGLVVVSLMGCARPSGDDSGPDDFARGVAHGYEMALDDLEDCALADGELEDFRACVMSRASGIVALWRHETDAERVQRGERASSSALQIWTGFFLKMGR